MDTKEKVAQFLTENNITFSTRYVGETVRENNWKCDAWRVTFSSGKSRFETDYYTGLGLRKQVKPMPNPPFRKGTLAYEEWEKSAYVPQKPCSADVLHSLTLDSSAIDTSFDYWCSDYGYDTDSISAFNTYQQCCKIAKELRQVFTNAQVETLRGLLEDY